MRRKNPFTRSLQKWVPRNSVRSNRNDVAEYIAESFVRQARDACQFDRYHHRDFPFDTEASRGEGQPTTQLHRVSASLLPKIVKVMQPRFDKAKFFGGKNLAVDQPLITLQQIVTNFIGFGRQIQFF